MDCLIFFQCPYKVKRFEVALKKLLQKNFSFLKLGLTKAVLFYYTRLNEVQKLAVFSVEKSISCRKFLSLLAFECFCTRNYVRGV